MLQQKVGSKERCIFEELDTRNVGVFSCERLKAKKFREDAEKEKQEGDKANGNVFPLPKNTWNE